MQLPARGERYRGPDGAVEVVATDGVQGKVTVQPAGGGPTREVALDEWRHTYVFAPHGSGVLLGVTATVNDELTAAARRGYEARVAGEPPPPTPEGAVEPE